LSGHRRAAKRLAEGEVDGGSTPWICVKRHTRATS
jgi:hypothetical protein